MAKPCERHVVAIVKAFAAYTKKHIQRKIIFNTVKRDWSDID